MRGTGINFIRTAALAEAVAARSADVGIVSLPKVVLVVVLVVGSNLTVVVSYCSDGL